jgi:hypothetical protein
VLPLLYITGGSLFYIALGLFVFYLLLIFFHAMTVNRHLGVACLSVVSALLQLWGYGLGFLTEKIRQARL